MTANKISVRMAERRAALVLQFIDSFTAQPVNTEVIRVQFTGEVYLPVRKPAGYCVWTDLPIGSYTLQVTSSVYQRKELLIKAEDPIWIQDTKKEAPVLKQFLDAGTNYPLPAGSTWVTGSFQAGERILILPKRESSSIVLRDAERGVVSFTPYSTYFHYDRIYNKNDTNRRLALAYGGTWEVFTVGDKVKEGSGQYYLLGFNNTAGHYQENDRLYPASAGQAYEDGTLFLPLWGILAEDKEIYVYSRDQDTAYVCGISYGKGNDITEGRL